jgi:hypothetical protein
MNALKWLILSLLAGVCILSISIYLTTYIKKDLETIEPAPPEAAAEGSDELNPDDTTTPSDDTPTVPTPVYSTLPRLAKNYDGLTCQNIGGTENDFLKEVFVCSDSSYAVFETSSNSYDVSSARSSVAIALIDADLTLKTVTTLPSSTNEYYLAGKPTAYGFAIAVQGEDYTRVYNIDYTLKNTVYMTFPYTLSAKLYSANGNIYMFYTNGEALSLAVFSQAFTLLYSATTLCDADTVVDCFFQGGLFKVFLSSDDACYNATSNGQSFNALTKLYDFKLDQITPTSTGYLLSLDNGDKSLVKLLDFSLSETNSVQIDSEVALSAQMNSCYLIATSAQSTSLNLYCKHLDKILEISQIEKAESLTLTSSSGNLYLTAVGNNTLSLFLVTEKGVTLLYKCYAVNTYTRLYDGFLYFCSSASGGVFTNGFGASDIYILDISSLM